MGGTPAFAELSIASTVYARIPQGGGSGASQAPAAPTRAVLTSPSGASPAEILTGLRAQQQEIRSQLRGLEGKRAELSRRITNGGISDADRAGLQARLNEMDKQISVVDKQLAQADADVARQAAIPGAVQPEPERAPQPHPNDADYELIALFGIIVLLPASIAFARRIWRRAAKAVPNWPVGMSERMERLEAAVDAIAVEVERVGEGQRFVTNMLADVGPPPALGAGAMNTIEAKQREREFVGPTTPH